MESCFMSLSVGFALNATSKGYTMLIQLLLLQDKLQISCFTVHRYPVENLAFDHSGTWLATGARHKLKVWKCLSSSMSRSVSWSRRSPKVLLDRLQHFKDIPAPRTVTAMVGPHEAVLITSLHWLRYGRDAGCLIVTYLYHGIVFVSSFLSYSRLLTCTAVAGIRKVVTAVGPCHWERSCELLVSRF